MVLLKTLSYLIKSMIMNKKSYLLGVLTGIVVTFLGLFIIGLINQNSEEKSIIQSNSSH